jgi:hypothetical protein
MRKKLGDVGKVKEMLKRFPLNSGSSVGFFCLRCSGAAQTKKTD